ncbi:thiolase family protein [Lawsonibacter celer]|uniref:thiolase family protein n=1 Tax=Lawsonibacter celer TaxID=2986526 RepID=UPI001648A823|nr:thiolase family protein [Lawsonibacter celer]
MENRKGKTAVIVAYGRSAVGKAKKGALSQVHPVDYAAEVLSGVLDRIPQLDRRQIDDVIVGCAKPEQTQGTNVGRVIAQRAQLPDEVPGQTVNRFCSSGLQAIATAANAIMAGQAEVIVAGGVESMSSIPMVTDPSFRNPWLVEHGSAVYMPMGITAENVAADYHVTRAEMDEAAAISHTRAELAQDSGAFEREIIPVHYVDGNGTERVFDKDEGIRRGTTAEGLAGLKPCFQEGGVVTAATSSQTSDGAGFVVLMSEEKAAELGVHPIARFLGYAVAGVPARVMGIGPMKAIPKVMKQVGLTVNDMDVIELNEAFAAQAIPCQKELGLNPQIVNPRGGAMALGHPLGATGAILVCKALSYLQDNGGRYGLVSMCIGGGMGAAGVFELL